MYCGKIPIIYTQVTNDYVPCIPILSIICTLICKFDDLSGCFQPICKSTPYIL